MKKLNLKVLFFLLIFIPAIISAQTNSSDTASDYNKKVTTVLEAYQKMISVPMEDDVEDLPGKAWENTAKAINLGYLRFTVTPSDNSLIKGVYFKPGEKVTYVVFTKNILDAWTSHPSLTYTVMTEAFQDVSDFFLNPNLWQAANSNSLELLLLRWNHYKTAALLIRDRLVPSGFLISPYESYILDSFEKDDLNSAVLFLERHSLPVAQAIYNLHIQYTEIENKTEKDNTDLRNSIIQLGEDLLSARKQIPEDAPDDTLYPVAVAIHSWLEFSPYVIADIYKKDGNQDLTFDKILSQEKDYSDLRSKMEVFRTKDMPKIDHVYKETVKGFEGR